MLGCAEHCLIEVESNLSSRPFQSKLVTHWMGVKLEYRADELRFSMSISHSINHRRELIWTGPCSRDLEAIFASAKPMIGRCKADLEFFGNTQRSKLHLTRQLNPEMRQYTPGP